jgi:hypothetical protein
MMTGRTQVLTLRTGHRKLLQKGLDGMKWALEGLGKGIQSTLRGTFQYVMTRGLVEWLK